MGFGFGKGCGGHGGNSWVIIIIIIILLFSCLDADSSTCWFDNKASSKKYLFYLGITWNWVVSVVPKIVRISVGGFGILKKRLVHICPKIQIDFCIHRCYNPEFDTCKRKKFLEPLKIKDSRNFVFSYFLSNVFLFLVVLKIFFISWFGIICRSVWNWNFSWSRSVKSSLT